MTNTIRRPFACLAAALCLTLVAGVFTCASAPAAHGLVGASAPQLQAQAGYTIDEVRTLIEQLPSVMMVQEADASAIRQTKEAYEQLSAADRALLDTETNRAALGTTQSYGRVLELAEAGLAVLYAVDNSTNLADGVYESSLTTNWDRGKSASKQEREWTAIAVRVESGEAFVTMHVNSPTYSYVRASGQKYTRLARSGSDESLFTFPVSLNQRMTITAYSQTMATEIAYFLTVSIPDGTGPDSDLPSGDDPDEGDPADPVEFDAPIVQTDEESGCTIVERGVFSHPEITAYMFRIVDPAIITSDGQAMSVYAEMPSQSYTYFFVGTKEEASEKTLEEGLADGSFIPAVPVLNPTGSTVSSFVFPLESLDCDMSVSLYSAKNQYWVERTIRFNSADLDWTETAESKAQLDDVLIALQNLPARNTIVPDNEEHEAAVQAVRNSYEALNRFQKSQVPPHLVLLLEWDESMFDLGFNTEFLPLAMKGQPYDGAIYLSGKNGQSGKSVRVVDGRLPGGLELSMDREGRWASFVGVPTSDGSETFTVEISNDLGECVSKEYTVHVGYAPHIVTDKLERGKIGASYQQVLVADAYPDASWSLLEGELPPGLALVDDGEDASTARIVGTPTEAGVFTFALACDNYANGIERVEYEIEVLMRDGTSIKDLKQGLADAELRISDLAATISLLKDQISQIKSQLPAKVVINSKTVTAKTVKTALKKANNPHATSVVLTGKVARIKAKAFKGTNVRTITAKTSKLTKKSVRNALKGSKVKTIKVSVAKSKLKKVKKAYRKAFSKQNSGRSVTIK